MGIKDFFKFLKSRAPECFHPTSFAELRHQRLAIDMMNVLYIYRARSAHDWMTQVLQFLLQLRHVYVHPVCVFDGTSHPLKTDTVQKRKDDRSRGRERVHEIREALRVYTETGERNSALDAFFKRHPDLLSPLTGQPLEHQIEEYLERQYAQYDLHFSAEEVTRLREMIAATGITVLVAEHDGEALCSFLSAAGRVDAVLSNDSDVFFFGCSRLLCKFTHEGAYSIRQDELLAALNLTQEQFTDMCLLCGTDFNTSVRGIGICRAYALVQQYGRVYHPEFPLRDQLDWDRLETVRRMTVPPSSLPECAYCAPDVDASFPALAFRDQVYLAEAWLHIPRAEPVLMEDGAQ